jgi:hypothetical protein
MLAYKTENISKVNLLSVIFSKHNLLGYFALVDANVAKKKFLPNFWKKVAKKYQNIYIENEFETLKPQHQTTVETLKCQRQTMC